MKPVWSARSVSKNAPEAKPDRREPIIDTPTSDAGIRDLAIPPHLIKIIKAHLAAHCQPGPDGLMFASGRRINLTTAARYGSYWPARAKAGRTDLRFHDLRTTGETLVAAIGTTLADLMRRLGHSTPQAATRYQHATRERDQAVASLLPELAIEDGVPLNRHRQASYTPQDHEAVITGDVWMAEDYAPRTDDYGNALFNPTLAKRLGGKVYRIWP
jgi:hypothetical protein